MPSIANPRRKVGYVINQNPSFEVTNKSFANQSDLSGLRTEILSNIPEFYEMELGEVITTYLDETSEDFPIDKNGEPEWSKYGTVQVKLAISSTSERDFVYAKPLDTNIKQYPLPGEFVIVVEHTGELYYTQRLNVSRIDEDGLTDFHNSPNYNFLPGLTKRTQDIKGIGTKINHFKPDSNIRQVQSYEGDITFNGRFGQSIRFGSNITKIDGEDDTGKDGSPNIIIKAGQWEIPDVSYKPVKEDVNKDGSSLWMTTDQTIPLDKNYHTEAHNKTLPKKWDGAQIVLNSDRIVFNSKENSIHAFSNVDISLSSKERINLESPIVNVGEDSRVAPQHALGAETLFAVLMSLCDALIDFGNDTKTAKGAPGIPWAPTSLLEYNAPAATMASRVKRVKKEFKDKVGMSDSVYISKIRT